MLWTEAVLLLVACMLVHIVAPVSALAECDVRVDEAQRACVQDWDLRNTTDCRGIVAKHPLLSRFIAHTHSPSCRGGVQGWILLCGNRLHGHTRRLAREKACDCIARRLHL